ncbi:MAG: hypothetical protein KDB26_11465 [Microthrixaceae bacterium]|nr:hypothetical protein [Microthrixaceae bacterium]
MELGFGIVDLEPGNDNSDLPALAPLVAAIAVPITLAACLIPVRGQLEHSAGMILVLPVIYCGVRPLRCHPRHRRGTQRGNGI